MITQGSRVARRAAEAATATGLFVVTVPLIIVCAALSFAHYRAWPFFVHERIGLDGRPFRFMKVRTLPPSTARYAAKYDLNPGHVPPIMQAIRRMHLDELPQFLHVARGTMAFVGPRPEQPMLHGSLGEAFARARTSVRPGLTCLWQISPHSVGLIRERPEYDRLYIEYRNLRLDLWIAAQTVRKMLTGRTTHLHEVPRWVAGGMVHEVAPRLTPRAVVAPVPTPVGIAD